VELPGSRTTTLQCHSERSEESLLRTFQTKSRIAMIPEWNLLLPACPDDAHAEIKIEQREKGSVKGNDGGHIPTGNSIDASIRLVVGLSARKQLQFRVAQANLRSHRAT
jgi:hypothetical protein